VRRAASLQTSANDQAGWLRFLLARGKGPKGSVLRPQTLEKMWTIQFPKKDEKAGFGLGFFVSEFEGRKRIGHGGAVYGFATELAALPDDKLGVIVCASKDVATAVTRRISAVAVEQMLA